MKPSEPPQPAEARPVTRARSRVKVPGSSVLVIVAVIALFVLGRQLLVDDANDRQPIWLSIRWVLGLAACLLIGVAPWLRSLWRGLDGRSLPAQPPGSDPSDPQQPHVLARSEANVLGLNLLGIIAVIALLNCIWPFAWIPWLLPFCRVSQQTAALSPEVDQKRKTSTARRLALLYGLALFGWPLNCFTCIFAFDSPWPNDWLSSLLSGYTILSIVLYPAFWIAGCLLGYFSAKRDKPMWLVVLLSSIPLLSVHLFMMLVLIRAILSQSLPFLGE